MGFTATDKVIAKAIDPKFKWMARDEDGLLNVYTNKPQKSYYPEYAQNGDVTNGYWDYDAKTQYDPNVEYAEMPFVDCFKAVRWGNDEPTLIKDIYSERLLDEVEHTYLNNLLAPFKRRYSIYITKNAHLKMNGDSDMWLEIELTSLENGLEYQRITMPKFKTGSMYNKMVVGRRYTSEELGL